MEIEKPTLTVKVTNLPRTVIAKDLYDFFESITGKDSVFACEIFSDHKNWKARDFGRVQFETLDFKSTAIALFQQGKLIFKSFNLSLFSSQDDIIFRPADPINRVENGLLRAGILAANLENKEEALDGNDGLCMRVLESWEGVRAWVTPERQCLEFWVKYNGVCYKLEVQFCDVLETSTSCLNGALVPNAILLKVIIVYFV